MKITGFSQDFSPQEALGIGGVAGGVGAVASDASATINYRVIIDASDTTSDYLGAKLAAGSNITLTTINVGGNEQVRIASTGGGAVSFGSNATDVGSADAGGADPNASRQDHVHRGVHLLTSNGSNALYGDVNLVAGANLTLTAAGQTLTLVGTGSGSTSFGSNATDVGNADAPGATVLSADAGHVHRGIHLLTSNGSNALYGDVNLVAGTGIALGVAGQGITVTSVAASGGASAADLVQTYAGAGSVYVPWMIGHPDRLPASPSADDEEFDAALSGSWTVQGSPDVSAANAAGFLSQYHIYKASGGNNTVYGAYKAIPAGGMPFTVVVKLTAMLWLGTYPDAWVGVGDSPATKVWGFGPNVYYSGLEIAAWTLPSNRTSSSGRQVTLLFRPYVYLWLVVNSSTSIDTWWSSDGYVYFQNAAGTNPGFTIGTIWLGIAGSTGSDTLEGVFDFMRFQSGAVNPPSH